MRSSVSLSTSAVGLISSFEKKQVSVGADKKVSQDLPIHQWHNVELQKFCLGNSWCIVGVIMYDICKNTIKKK